MEEFRKPSSPRHQKEKEKDKEGVFSPTNHIKMSPENVGAGGGKKSINFDSESGKFFNKLSIHLILDFYNFRSNRFIRNKALDSSGTENPKISENQKDKGKDINKISHLKIVSGKIDKKEIDDQEILLTDHSKNKRFSKKISSRSLGHAKLKVNFYL